jgi:hypothetical protein
MVNRSIAIFRSMMRLKESYAPRKRNSCKGILRSKWSWVFVGRRGTNQLCLLERYLDVLVKNTTEIPPPTALVEGVSLR